MRHTTVLSDITAFDARRRGFTADDLHGELRSHVEIRGMGHVLREDADQLAGLVAEDPTQGRVHAHETPVEPDDGDSVRRMLERAFESLVATVHHWPRGGNPVETFVV